MAISTIISWCKSFFGLPPQPIHRVATALTAEVPAHTPQTQWTAQEIDEVAKVEKRLAHWATHQTQINAQILNAYLTLEREGFIDIYKSDLELELPKMVSFEQNFNQMKIIAQHNHGKIFEVDDNKVTIWRAVESAVRQYEREVLGSSAYL
ncbi:hypothetical protein [Aliivibrio kagoshimensis]|uniref:hypothetical protein n=1 Tax=Aliivibrio kagoshimensis TaxID=2910230 RepID=UPI003D12E103